VACGCHCEEHNDEAILHVVIPVGMRDFMLYQVT